MNRIALVMIVVTIGVCIVFKHHVIAQSLSKEQMQSEISTLGREIETLQGHKRFVEGDIQSSEFDPPELVERWRQDVKQYEKEIEELKARKELLEERIAGKYSLGNIPTGNKKALFVKL